VLILPGEAPLEQPRSAASMTHEMALERLHPAPAPFRPGLGLNGLPNRSDQSRDEIRAWRLVENRDGARKRRPPDQRAGGRGSAGQLRHERGAGQAG
jgi:hypothetical protein